MTQQKTEEDIAKEKQETNKEFEKDIARINKEENEKKRLEALEESRFRHQREWAKTMDELRQSHFLPKNQRREGGPQTHWDEAKQLADDIINSKQTSINDWRSNMMDLLNMFTKLNKAINISSNQVSGEAVDLIKNATNRDETPILRAITHPKERMYEAVKSVILDKIKGNNDVKIEAIKHKVTFKDGKVDVAPLTRADGIPFDKENDANKAFKKFVELWLMENQYVPANTNNDGSYVHFPDGTPLTEDVFNDLNSAPTTSFSNFLSQSASFKFEEQEELQSGQTLTNT
ncbi:hypothetical protein [Legionella parisiensis]|uniref:Membrane-associated HD superfamily hydrolase n=1 Tax=Legionella parisiensis TaxID=45071 RepID=A0A1E5JNT7_9GAMM|nr:hypothetical protein [Legionella parisiensis]KTD41383.1 membrane-associated HD superfamily hydrolase [Legionella parisiensis]OEH46130.1 hypothetical protein lpari_02863 [Legionella parisiensis]STX76314.1 membrane-associated HD superfamily hydrolase [Legionella parisiensis]